MKARYSYPLLFLLPSAMASLVAAVMAAAAGAGVMWIFLYGDNPWPPQANIVLMTVAGMVAALVLAGFLVLSYRVGKAREARGGLSRSHVLVALGLCVGLPLLVLAHQWKVGNLGSSRVPADNPSRSMPLRAE